MVQVAMQIRIDHVTKSYGAARAVDELTLHISDGEFLVLLGPSGCGKTTTMRAIVGLETPDTGRIEVGDQVVFDAARGINIPTNKRRMGMVFQSYAIWPHKSVSENVSFPLEQQHLSRAEIRKRVRETLDLVGLAHLEDRGASFLSGGQMQRVALARSVVGQPRVLLLDEPLSNLDAKLREKLRFELREIQQRLGTTTVYVTHDQTEALALADRVAVMRDGRIVQIDRPDALYKRPRNTFVADFLGVSNIFAARVTARTAEGGSRVRIEPGGPVLSSAFPAEVGQEVHVCIRPEHVQIAASSERESTDGLTLLDGELLATVKVASFLGSQVRYLLHAGNSIDMEAISTNTEDVFKAGASVGLSIPPSCTQLLRD
jgi:iron(III) transport system ATP-binding protein